ncbi:achaete-scute complex protein T3-like [Sitophilus oryzae]|uniref:Achaete-scute complex protein T3-like n=1 Tax=Sitophilus oryzae TaxID=7048 RepID=A0A6J2XTI6_SITOR|nr:achaete-scute complex protein T3-like [Sitophilus oryzae]
MYGYTSYDQEPDYYWTTEERKYDFYIKSTEMKKKQRQDRHFSYKHVPHSERPPQVVEKRNARERRRVQAVNSAFVKLRNAIPIQNSRGKRISKVKTLLHAIEYIRLLNGLLRDYGNYACSYETEKYEGYECDIGDSCWDPEQDIVDEILS